jgi:hypothetical protein
MADDADVKPVLDPEFEDKVERKAMSLLREGAAENMDAARRQARRILEDSEGRKIEGWELEPDDDNVIRRSSSETAAIGDTGTFRVVSDGD